VASLLMRRPASKSTGSYSDSDSLRRGCSDSLGTDSVACLGAPCRIDSQSFQQEQWFHQQTCTAGTSCPCTKPKYSARRLRHPVAIPSATLPRTNRRVVVPSEAAQQYLVDPTKAYRSCQPSPMDQCERVDLPARIRTCSARPLIRLGHSAYNVRSRGHIHL
jgi:hypothetical protein